MKKVLVTISALLLTAMLAVTCISCGKSADNTLTGTWESDFSYDMAEIGLSGKISGTMRIVANSETEGTLYEGLNIEEFKNLLKQQGYDPEEMFQTVVQLMEMGIGEKTEQKDGLLWLPVSKITFSEGKVLDDSNEQVGTYELKDGKLSVTMENEKGQDETHVFTKK